MTWEQFKSIIEARMEEQGIQRDVPIQFVVVGDLYTDCISVGFEQGGLSISNEESHVSATTKAIGTITWQQFGGIVEKRIGEQDIPGDARLWFIDVLCPHASEEERICVEFKRERGGLWISNI